MTDTEPDVKFPLLRNTSLYAVELNVPPSALPRDAVAVHVTLDTAMPALPLGPANVGASARTEIRTLSEPMNPLTLVTDIVVGAGLPTVATLMFDTAKFTFGGTVARNELLRLRDGRCEA